MINLEKSETASLPTEFGDFSITVYRNIITKIEYPVLRVTRTNARPIVRIHSECLTGDIMHGLNCDCKQELHYSLRKISHNGNGALIYLKGQEGRGIGLFNKINAYHLQEQGFDTVEANIQLGFPADNRNYDDAVYILKDLGLQDFNLITGNPDKVDFLRLKNFNITAVPAAIEMNKHNSRYINTKKSKMNHSFDIKNTNIY